MKKNLEEQVSCPICNKPLKLYWDVVYIDNQQKILQHCLSCNNPVPRKKEQNKETADVGGFVYA